jgi:TetR/AcrR family transcriptional regulator of autoinduction and epiphytic fitness
VTLSATPAAPDRRAALKARHRSAILAAALVLVDERGGPGFSVDELAERADVARRTVFNHFASMDEILLSLCAHELEVVIDDFVGAVAAGPKGDGSKSSMFEEIASTLRSADLPSAIASIGTIMGKQDHPDVDDPRGRALSDEAFARVAGRLHTEVGRRYPEADRLEVAFLVGSLINGVIVIAKEWILRTGVRLDDTGRAEWQQLLTRLIDSVRAGYAPTT